MRTVALALVIFALASIGFGQVRTEKQQEAVNKKAKWVAVGSDENDDTVYMDVSDVSKVATLALFNVKMEKRGILLYSTMVVNCLTEGYLVTNVFAQSSPNAALVRMKSLDMAEPVPYEKGGAVYDMAEYACRYGKPLDKD